MTLTDERRKALMKYLGDGVDRAFTTDADMMALFRKTVDNGKWFSCENSFWDYAFFVWRADRDNDKRDYSAWLFYDPARFCCLVAEWLEVKK